MIRTKAEKEKKEKRRNKVFVSALKNSSFIVLAAFRKTIFLQPHIAFFNFSFIWSNFVLSFYEFFFLSSLMLVICLPLFMLRTEKVEISLIPPTFSGFDMVEEKCTHWQKKIGKNSTPCAHQPSSSFSTFDS